MEQRVLLCMLDTIDWPTAFLGCIKAGVVPVAVNTLLIPTDDEFMLRKEIEERNNLMRGQVGLF